MNNYSHGTEFKKAYVAGFKIAKFINLIINTVNFKYKKLIIEDKNYEKYFTFNV